MADIRFYHMERSALEQVLPQLLGKALQGGHKVIVRCPNKALIDRLSELLWTYDAASFLPHGSSKDSHAQLQPIWLTDTDDNPNEAGVLILTHGAESGDISEYSMVCEMLDGRDQEAVGAARSRWKDYKDGGHEVTYWQQGTQGGWEKKA